MAASPVQVQKRLISVDEYERMVQAGVFAEDDRLELIFGEIVAMSPIGAQHVLVVNRLNNALVPALSGQALVSVQNPVRLLDSEPQPDLTLLRLQVEEHPDSLPLASDVLLLVEVSDTSVEYDRLVKLPLYAAAGIREVWIVDVAEQAVEVYREPGAGGYRTKRTLGRGDTLAPLAFPGVTLDVTEMLGRR